MREAILNFIRENNLSLFERNTARAQTNSSFKTKDAKDVQSKVLDIISNNFIFNDTKQILKLFSFSNSPGEIKKRQTFFKSLSFSENNFLKTLQKPRPFWRPKYDIVAATEDEQTLIQLQRLNCPVVFINSESDLAALDRYELVQVIDCENFSMALERLPQAMFVNNIENIFLERFLISLSGWKNNLEVLKSSSLTQDLASKIGILNSLISLIDERKEKKISYLEVETAMESINRALLDTIKNMTLSGESVLSLLSKGIPKEIKSLIEIEIKKSEIPEELFEFSIPLKIDEKELEIYLKRQSAKEFTNASAIVNKNADKIKDIPKSLQTLQEELVYFDFVSGISKFIKNLESFPQISAELSISNSKNLFLSSPQPISFNLSGEFRCSILTGANSGGKTTLIEHLLQLVVLSQIGLPTSGQLDIPLFTDVYYFAKNKGSMSKGAFETLLTQMSEINPGEKTLILADEIEAVTEPGVAGEIIVSTAEFFLKQNCFLVVATHLGQEIQHLLPKGCRIDGIEAKGLTENYELIVDHNPVLGRLANSTPELIVEKMAKSLKKDYFIWLHENLKKR